MSEALLRALQQRATLNALVRRFFAERDVLEVETPILSVAGNTEPNIDSFHTDFTGHVDAGGRRRWLRTSPEYPLKRLLAAGVYMRRPGPARKSANDGSSRWVKALPTQECRLPAVQEPGQ